MTAHDDIALADREFRETVLSSLGRIEQQQLTLSGENSVLKACLYGQNGAGGLVRAVADLEHNTASWNRGLAVIQALITAALIYFGLKVE